jgi:hypothetical protein
MLNNNIFILWLQGWENASWLNLQVAESWKINNPEWNVHLIDICNLKDYVSDIDYIYDTNKNISPQAKSDIIRLSLLKNHGGVWADATMLCMQPLDHWVYEATKPVGFWMYHGHGGGMDKENGPAIWFIISENDNYLINQWKSECDKYWNSDSHPYSYFWLDEWFKTLFHRDHTFRDLWSKVPYLYCELDGQSHTLAHYKMDSDTQYIKDLFETKPPYALKFWSYWNTIFPDITTEKCINSNGYCAIQLSKRQYRYKHTMS